MPASSSAPAPTRKRLIDGTRQALMTAAAAWISYASSSLIGLREGFWAALVLYARDRTHSTKREHLESGAV